MYKDYTPKEFNRFEIAPLQNGFRPKDSFQIDQDNIDLPLASLDSVKNPEEAAERLQIIALHVQDSLPEDSPLLTKSELLNRAMDLVQYCAGMYMYGEHTEIKMDAFLADWRKGHILLTGGQYDIEFTGLH